MVAAAKIVIMVAAKKAQQNVFALYHSHNARSTWDSSGFYTFISRLSSCFAGVIWFPYDVIMAKEKYGLHDACTILIFSTDGGCTRWIRRLHLFPVGNFWHTHSRSPADKYAYIGSMIVLKCDTFKISGACTHLDCITSIVGDIVNP